MKSTLPLIALLLFSLSAGAKPTESELLASLDSRILPKMKSALQDLPKYYPVNGG